MAKRIILLSGPVAAGKTTLGDALVDRYGLVRVKTRHLLEALGVRVERGSLQRAGANQDRRTGGRWVRDALVRLEGMHPEAATILVDAVRIPEQITAIRESYGLLVVHVHLTAPREVLAGRYAARVGAVRELPSYDKVASDPTERRVGQLAELADILVDTDRCQSADVVVRVASHLGFYGRGLDRLVDVLVGGQYGSEGKGNVAAYLAPEYDVLIRVGGPNAGHKVFGEPPYAFHSLPSGTQRSRANLVVGPGAMIWLPTLMKEIAECEVATDRLCIDPDAMLIEPFDREREKRGLERRIGSTAQGVGFATARKILRGAGPGPRPRLARDAAELAPFLKETIAVLEDAFAAGKRVFLEGTQGTGLSLHHGSYPHVTSRDTTVSGCLSEAGVAPSRVRRVVVVCRTFPIRVESPKGRTSGPMSHEIDWRTIAQRSGVPEDEILRTEKTTTTGKQRRVAEFDWSLLRTSVSLNAPTDIALTFADYLSVKNRDAHRFEQLTDDTIRFIEELERVGGAPVSLIATGFNWRSIIDRRRW